MDKCFATCYDPDVTLNQAAFGPIGCVDGFFVSGVPTGKPDWVKAQVAGKLARSVADRLMAARHIGGAYSAQSRALLSSTCAGACQVNHLLRVMPVASASQGFSHISQMIVDDSADRWGLFDEDLGTLDAPSRLLQRMQLPHRLGGGGLRTLTGEAGISDAALLGGWVAAAYEGDTTLADMDPDTGDGSFNLAAVCADPDRFSHLPHVAALQAAWKRVVSASRHIESLATAAALNALPQTDLETAFDKAWMAEHAHGKLPTPALNAPPPPSSADLMDDLKEACLAAFADLETDVERGKPGAALRLACANDPGDHLSTLRDLCAAGWIGKDDDGKGWTVQRLLSRVAARDRFLAYFGEPGDESLSDDELAAQVQHRAHISTLASIFLTVIPGRKSRSLTDDQFFWLTRARMNARHPQTACLPARCPCRYGNGPPLRGTQGHHLRACLKGGGANFVHDSLRDCLAAICKRAGCRPDIERRHIVKDSAQRPGDVIAYDVSWTDEEGVPHCEDLVLDVTVHDYDVLPRSERKRRARNATRSSPSPLPRSAPRLPTSAPLPLPRRRRRPPPRRTTSNGSTLGGSRPSGSTPALPWKSASPRAAKPSWRSASPTLLPAAVPCPLFSKNYHVLGRTFADTTSPCSTPWLRRTSP